jgi:phosphoenolpyruvate carboxykinase (ATP)
MNINLDSDKLAHIAVELEGGTYLPSGAIAVNTVPHTGRSPNAKRFVKDENTIDNIDWSNNKEISENDFNKILAQFKDFSNRNSKSIHLQQVKAVRDPRRSMEIHVYSEFAKHALFVRNMFVPLDLLDGSIVNTPDYTVYHFPTLLLEPTVLISISSKTILISGTLYSGEIKKSVFSVLNYHFPENNDLPMHCSVNVDKSRENACIFFGLSGTGKTTLSSDVNRILIGDDEHGWTNDGLTNFEGGCYAKTINLSQEDEPQIWHACQKKNSILENVVLVDGGPDFNDGTHTENTRASYPSNYISGADEAGYVDAHPKNIIMLTCDAFGVLPAVVKLDSTEAIEQFLLGYTAKVAGTESGVTEPEATFSSCFGAPFMPLPPIQYASILKEKIETHEVDCWLVNTGWTGGPYGVGSRMPIKTTRLIIDKILDGTLSDCKLIEHHFTNFKVPVCEDISLAVLFPENGWENLDDYRIKAEELMKMFADTRKLYF